MRGRSILTRDFIVIKVDKKLFYVKLSDIDSANLAAEIDLTTDDPMKMIAEKILKNSCEVPLTEIVMREMFTERISSGNFKIFAMLDKELQIIDK